MAFSGNSGGSGSEMSEINVTPLVDVMLVLLIIFMITAPLMSHKIPIKLPEAPLSQKEDETPRPVIYVAVKDSGEVFWNDESVSEAVMQQKMRVAAQQSPQPEIQIRGDKTTRYQYIAAVMGEAKKSGILKLGFMTTGAAK